MFLLKIKSALLNFIKSYLTMLIILALGLFTYWQTLYLNKNQKLFTPTDLSKFHTPLYQLENVDFSQYQQTQTNQTNQTNQQTTNINQYQLHAQKAVQYADDKNFELLNANFEKEFLIVNSPAKENIEQNIEKNAEQVIKQSEKTPSKLYISSNQALLDANFNQLQLKENVWLKRQDANARLELKANQAVLELRKDVISLQKVNAHYQNIKTQAQHRFSAEKASWDEQKQKLDAQNIKIHFENPQRG